MLYLFIYFPSKTARFNDKPQNLSQKVRGMEKIGNMDTAIS